MVEPLTTFLIYVAIFILSELLRPKPKFENAKPAGLGDFAFATATEERVVPLMWGTVQFKGPNVVWYGDLRPKAIKDKVKTGLFSSTNVVTGYRYFVGIQFALCRGSVTDTCDLLRMWNGEKEIYTGPTVTTDNAIIDIDLPKLYGGTDEGNGGLVGTLRWYTGSAAQAFNQYLSAFQDEGGATPRYIRTCYAVWEGGKVGNSPSVQPWWFEVKRIPTGLGGPDSEVNIVGDQADANPAHVLYEAVTDDEWGLGYPTGDIDSTSFLAAAATLKTEGNGFSLILDRELEVSELMEQVEDQIQGKVILNQSTGLWELKLARNDYTIGSIPELDETNILEITNFSRGAWSDTVNHLTVQFKDRSLDYKGTYALAQDMANQRIQSETIKANQQYPGCKDAHLANNLAWRTLRTLARPMAKATVVVNRTQWALGPLDVVKYTDNVSDLGVQEFVMRVMRVDLGEIDAGRIELSLVEDVFAFSEPSFADPFGTGWILPTDTQVDLSTDRRVVIEAPRGFITREPSYDGGAVFDRVWAGFNQQNGSLTCTILSRNAPSNPSGNYAFAGKIGAPFMRGSLFGILAQGDHPANIRIVPDLGNTQQEFLDEFPDEASEEEVGRDLKYLMLIDNEFIGFRSVVANGPNIDLTDCFRELLDRPQKRHLANASVFIISVAGLLTTNSYPSQDEVDIKLLPESNNDVLLEASASEIALGDLTDRVRRPYTPALLMLNTDIYPSGSVDLDVFFSGGSTSDEKGVFLEMVRRDFRTDDEVASVKDENSLPADYPAANTTQHQVEVREFDNTLLFTIAWGVQQNDFELIRTEILVALDSVVPATLRFVAKVRHTFESVVYEATFQVFQDTTVNSSELGSLTAIGARDDNVNFLDFTANDTGTYTFTIGTDLITGSGALEAEINGGGFVTVISSGGGDSGTLAGVTSGDTITTRHTQTGAGTAHTQLIVENNASANIAQGQLIV